jgi:hypothetical protein
MFILYAVFDFFEDTDHLYINLVSNNTSLWDIVKVQILLNYVKLMSGLKPFTCSCRISFNLLNSLPVWLPWNWDTGTLGFNVTDKLLNILLNILKLIWQEAVIATSFCQISFNICNSLPVMLNPRVWVSQFHGNHTNKLLNVLHSHS